MRTILLLSGLIAILYTVYRKIPQSYQLISLLIITVISVLSIILIIILMLHIFN